MIFDIPPQYVQTDLDNLSAGLDAQIPAKTINNFLVATRNIRAFASLTRKVDRFGF